MKLQKHFFGLFAAICTVGQLGLLAAGSSRAKTDSQPESANRSIIVEFYDMAERTYPDQFERYYGEADAEDYRMALELGARVYRREGCNQCHTQKVRSGTIDVQRWGTPNDGSVAEFEGINYTIAGTRRLGPDLGRESNRRSNDWHGAHLYYPRAMVNSSLMPAFPWLFDQVEGRTVPNEEGLALIVYLQTLGSDYDADRR